MIILHINPKNNDITKPKLTDQLNKHIKDGKDVFILFYMEGCGPCGLTRPEWAKIENVLKQKYSSQTGDNIVVADIDHRLIHLLKNVGNDPNGFPTMRYIKKDGNIVEDYEDSQVSNKDRKIDSFVEWIESKVEQKGGSKNKNKNKNKLSKTRKIMKQKGGLMINANDREAFEHFIRNSTIQFLGKGSFGVTFIATLDPNIQSNYTFISAENFGKPVKTLLFKLTFLHDENKGEKPSRVSINPRYTTNNQQIHFNTAPIDEFKNEVNIQTNIFLKSMNYLQPICPAIVYANVYNNYNTSSSSNMDINTLLQILDNNSKHNTFTNNIINEIIQSHKAFGDFSNLGVIAMELASGYETMSRIKHDATDEETKKKFIFYIFMCYYLLIRLARETGYSQADFHQSNIMIKPNCISYFGNKKGKGCPLLIDFGFAVKISSSVMKRIKTAYEQKKYTDILRILCNIRRSDNLDLKRSPPHYGWVCGNYDNVSNNFILNRITSNFIPNTDKYIEQLIDAREQTIDMVIALFDKYHSKNPDLYPLLPLSNSAKNKMYSGMLDVTYLNTNDENNENDLMDESSQADSYSSVKAEMDHDELVDDMDRMNIRPLSNDSSQISDVLRQNKKQRIGGKWSRKYKHSINCRRPKGFSQKQYCKYGRNKNKTKRNNKNRNK